ncbi:MAG: response regulator [Thermodesulfobacteriota bacterium]
MKSARIMIVEDDLIVAADLNNRLEEMGYLVCAQATTGEEAVFQVKHTDPDIILMDITLQGRMDGIEAAEEINRRHVLPIIFLTAHGDEGMVSRAKATEPFGLVLKPFNDQQLQASIEIALYKSEMEKKLKASEERFRAFADYTYDWETWLDPKGRYIYVTPSCRRITGHGHEEFLRDSGLMQRITHPEDQEALIKHENLYQVESGPMQLDFRIIDAEGQEKWISHQCQSILSSTGEWLGRRGSNRDVTELKSALTSLRAALDEVKTLRGFLPICTCCKKIRDDAGYWQQLEKYIQDRTEALFSHSICPECARKLYPEFYGKE